MLSRLDWTWFPSKLILAPHLNICTDPNRHLRSELKLKTVFVKEIDDWFARKILDRDQVSQLKNIYLAYGRIGTGLTIKNPQTTDLRILPSIVWRRKPTMNRWRLVLICTIILLIKAVAAMEATTKLTLTPKELCRFCKTQSVYRFDRYERCDATRKCQHGRWQRSRKCPNLIVNTYGRCTNSKCPKRDREYLYRRGRCNDLHIVYKCDCPPRRISTRLRAHQSLDWKHFILNNIYFSPQLLKTLSPLIPTRTNSAQVQTWVKKRRVKQHQISSIILSEG